MSVLEVLGVQSKADQHSASTDPERRPYTRNEIGMQAQEDMVMEEMRLRRWSTVKRTTSES